MTEYKKPAPENTSDCMTHSVGREFEPDIEWHLACILDLIKVMKDGCRDLVLNEISDFIDEIKEIEERVRKAWDLVPDKETCCHCFCCVECQGACHHCGENYVGI